MGRRPRRGWCRRSGGGHRSRGGGRRAPTFVRRSGAVLGPPARPPDILAAMSRSVLAAAIAAASRSLHSRGWVANHDGNISVRLGPDRFLVTPTAVSKAEVTEGGLAVVCGKGQPVEGEWKAPSEFALHLAAYAVRDDIGAVVHAHPPHATAMACAGVALDRPFLAEAVVSLGLVVPLSAFALPFGEEGARPVAELAPFFDAILLRQHGVLTLGKDLAQAMLRMELVEQLARIWLLAAPLGGPKLLPDEVLEPLLLRRRNAGLGKAADATASMTVANPISHSPSSTESPAWRPAGPAPAPDAWSGGAVQAACGRVYGAPDEPVRASSPASLESTIRDEIVRHLRGA